MAVWSRLLVTYFTHVIIVINEIPTWQNMPCECRMCRIDAGVQNCDFDRTVWSDALVDLVCQRQVNLFWRPLRHESSVVTANTPGVADAPGIATTNRRFRHEIRFNENDPRIMRQCVYHIFDGNVVFDSQSEDGSGSELIERSRIERILVSNRRQIVEAGQFDNNLTRDKLFTTVTRIRETVLTHLTKHVDGKKQQNKKGQSSTH